MPIEFTSEFIDKLEAFIEQKKEKEVLSLLDDLHPADIADIIDVLNIDQAKFIYLLLDGETASDVLVQIPEDDRRRFLEVLPSDLIARQFIEYMDSDDATDVLGELSEEKRESVLGSMKDLEQASDILDLLKYDEDTAGGLMAKELVMVNENWTVQTCLKEISRQAEDVDEIYYVYVVDDSDVLKGVLSLKKLILNPTHTNIQKIYNDDVISVRTDADSEDVALVMEKYDLVALPVIDEIGVLRGRITIDDVVHVIREEAEKDFQMATGISEDVDPSDNVGLQVRARLPWLLVGLIGGVCGAMVVGNFEVELASFPILATFMPLIAAMGGNVGVQSSSIVVQALAVNKLDVQGIGPKILKELSVALINGSILSLAIFMYNTLFSDSMLLTYTVSIALFSVVIIASLMGTFIPMILNRIKIDPALATGPFITTMNDILGMSIYLMVAKLMFG